ncbi:transposase [Candidatus Vondammii sp. HM_W22]|uniref:transposase n=1 Tax=Candidatus Vondammii sp. HM_W22 TaxID=2687299 RepID=UPI001F148539|nr:transposase [Candidatus Vondammii sp. HM_W22]
MTNSTVDKSHATEFFDHQDRLEFLEQLGDPLPKLERTVGWEAFRVLPGSFYKNSNPSKGGRPPCDAVLMFKMLVLQHLFNLSDDQTEFQIQDSYSFCRFLGLSPEGNVPDVRTVWVYREYLKERDRVRCALPQSDSSLCSNYQNNASLLWCGG